MLCLIQSNKILFKITQNFEIQKFFELDESVNNGCHFLQKIKIMPLIL